MKSQSIPYKDPITLSTVQGGRLRNISKNNQKLKLQGAIIYIVSNEQI